MTGGSNATIYDVARLAGVSPSTVSRAYSRPGRVSPDTSELIRASAATLGYRCRAVRAAEPEHTRVLALLVPDASSRFDAELIRQLGTCASLAGYSVAVVLLGEEEGRWRDRESLERVLPAVEGVMISAPRMPDSAIRVIAKQRPTIVLNRVVADVPSVVRDNHDGMRQAVEHLAALGHDSLSYLSGPADSWADGVRWHAVRATAAGLGLRARRIGPLASGAAGTAAGLRVIDDVRADGTSAVIAHNDALAIGLVRALTAHGLRVPRDLSVVGVDNIEVASLMTPSLTTVDFSLRSMGVAVTSVLDSLIRGVAPTPEDEIQVLPARLVVRGSTAQRRRNSTSPAFGTTSVSGSAS